MLAKNIQTNDEKANFIKYFIKIMYKSVFCTRNWSKMPLQSIFFNGFEIGQFQF